MSQLLVVLCSISFASLTWGLLIISDRLLGDNDRPPMPRLAPHIDRQRVQ